MTARQRFHAACLAYTVCQAVPVAESTKTAAEEVYRAMLGVVRPSAAAWQRAYANVSAKADETMDSPDFLMAALALIEPIVAEYSGRNTIMAHLWTDLRDALADEYDKLDPEWVNTQAVDNGVAVAEMIG